MVAHGLVKETGLPSLGDELAKRQRENNLDPDLVTPMFDQEGIHSIYRGWRRIMDSYDGDRIMVAMSGGKEAVLYINGIDSLIGQGAAGTGSAPPQPDATDASGARSASDAKESGASDERSLALRFTTLLLLRH